MEKVILYFALAVILFFIQNCIGSRTYSKGYIRFSLFDSSDEAFSINYVIKVIGPIVFLIIVVAVLQYFKLDSFIEGILSVIYIYIGIRLTLIFVYERAAIVNWVMICFYYASIIVFSNIIYYKFITSVSTLLPDFTDIKNEIWLLIILFIYQIGNSVGERSIPNPYYEPEQAFLPEFKKRKRKYVIKKYNGFKSQYETEINKISAADSTFNLVIFSIIIFENFNRPTAIRSIERLWAKVSHCEVTQGIMQQPSRTPLSDLQSIKIGTEFLHNKYRKIKDSDNDYSIYRRVIKKQCPDKKYVRQVLFIAKAIIDQEHNNGKYSRIFNEIKSEFNLYDIID